MMLEDEVELVLLAPRVEIVVTRSPITCTPWVCAGHRTRAETKAIHDAINAGYEQEHRPS